MDREKAILLIRSSSSSTMAQVITEYLRDKGYSDEKISECLSYLYLHNIMLMQEITEAIIEHLMREHNICKLIRLNPLHLRGGEELIMVF